MKSLLSPLMGRLLHLVQRGRTWAGPQPAQVPPGCTKCTINGLCTLHISVFLYNGPLLCGFNVPIEGLKQFSYAYTRIGSCSGYRHYHAPSLSLPTLLISQRKFSGPSIRYKCMHARTILAYFPRMFPFANASDTTLVNSPNWYFFINIYRNQRNLAFRTGRP